MSYHSTIHLDDFIRVNVLITQSCSQQKNSLLLSLISSLYGHSWALLWGPDMSCSTSTSEIMWSKCESCILLQRWCIAHLTAELLHTTGVFTFQARWDESANTCEEQTRERERKRLRFVTADLSYHLMPSHDRFSKTRPETYAHAHSHMPTWLGLIFPRRPSVKQFVRKFNSSQMLWQRMMRNHCAVYNSGYSCVKYSFLLVLLCLRLLSVQNHLPKVAKCITGV